MAEKSAISWTDSTFNPVIGCTRVGPGCDHCYAARDNGRRKWVASWGEVGGPPSPRRRTKTWDQPVKWNRQAAITGYRPRVFCASLADVFDNEVPDEWRTDLWALLRATPNLRWMLLTKRIGNARKMLPADWPFPHVGLMATMVNQEEWDRDIGKLMTSPSFSSSPPSECWRSPICSVQSLVSASVLSRLSSCVCVPPIDFTGRRRMPITEEDLRFERELQKFAAATRGLFSPEPRVACEAKPVGSESSCDAAGRREERA